MCEWWFGKRVVEVEVGLTPVREIEKRPCQGRAEAGRGGGRMKVSGEITPRPEIK